MFLIIFFRPCNIKLLSLNGHINQAEAWYQDPVFTAAPKVPNKTSIPENDGASVATEAQISNFVRSGMGSQYLTVAIEDLQSTINSLPRLLNKDIYINVLPGDIRTQRITVSRFFGQGRLYIRAVDQNNVIQDKSPSHIVQDFYLNINTGGAIHLHGFTILPRAGQAIGSVVAGVAGNQSTCINYVEQCVIDQPTQDNPSTASTAIYADYFSFILVDSCSINNKKNGIYANHASNVTIQGIIFGGAMVSPNNVLYARAGSIISINGNGNTYPLNAQFIAENGGLITGRPGGIITG